MQSYEDLQFGSAAVDSDPLPEAAAIPVLPSTEQQKRSLRQAKKGDPCWDFPQDPESVDLPSLIDRKAAFMSSRSADVPLSSRLRVSEFRRLYQISSLVIVWLTLGFSLPFDDDFRACQPPRPVFSYSSAQVSFISAEIERLLLSGAIVQVLSGLLKTVSPLWTAEKKGGKLRLIFDLSFQNRFLGPAPFSLDDLRVVQSLVSKDCFFASIDLQDAFLHLRHSPRASSYLGFEWLGKFYAFLVAPFGSKYSPIYFASVMLQVAKDLRHQGVILNIFYDDILIIGTSPREVHEGVLRTLCLLYKLGLTVNFQKSELVPTQKIIYLGLEIDSREECFRVPQHKVEDTCDLIRKALHDPSSLHVKQVAKICGVVQAMALALSHAASLVRSLYRDIESRSSWSSQVSLSESSVADLRLLLSSFAFWNGAVKWSHARRCVSVGSDASRLRFGNWFSGEHVVLKSSGVWFGRAKRASSNWKELAGAYLALFSYRFSLQNTRVYLFLDNSTAVAYVLRCGGMVPELTKLARMIFHLSLQFDFDIRVKYWPGRLHLLADAQSRLLDRSDWMLNPRYFKQIQSFFGLLFTVDRFASFANRQVPRYNSFQVCVANEAVDALSVDWSGEVNYGNPPWFLIGRVLSHVRKCRVTAVLVLPVWESQPWWPLLMRLVVRVMPLPLSPDLFLSAETGHEFSVGSPRWRCSAFLVDGRRV